MSKILLIGANGQLGQEFSHTFKSGLTAIGKIDEIYDNIEIKEIDYPELDLTDKKAVFNEISKGYDFVINCSAYTAVDKAEDDVINCYKVNTFGVQNLAYACKKYDATLVHFSTDYVYKGNLTQHLTETDVCEPETVYGKTKVLGETYIRNICDKYFILRTSWLYGKYGKNFVYKMLELAEKNPTIKVVSDQFGTPTNANDLVYVVLKLIQTDYYGIYNCTGNGETNWHEFAKKIFELAKKDIEVLPVTSEEFNSRAKRPKYSVLWNLALQCIGLDNMRNWEDALKSFMEDIK